MTSANWTKINFSIYELLHMIGRIEMANDIAYFKLSKLVIFPRLKTHNVSDRIYNLPTNNEIQDVLNQAIEAAILRAAEVGMCVDRNDICSCKLRKGFIPNKKICIQPNDMNSQDSIINQIDFTHFRQFTEEGNEFDSNSSFILIPEDGAGISNASFIKKSYIVWLLSQSKSKLSNDRLKRVQQRKDGESNGPKKKRAEIDISKSNGFENEDNSRKSEIEVGDWCIFKEEIQCNVAGEVLGFKYSNGRTEKDKQYILDSAPVFDDNAQLEVLATWYKLNDEFTIQPITKPSFYIKMDQYVKHIDPEQLKKILAYNFK